MPTTEEVIDHVTHTIEKSADVRASFGEPVCQGNITVLPVARTRVRAGGGGSTGQHNGAEEGRGMKMGVVTDTTPVGFICLHDGEAHFEPIVDQSTVIQRALMVGGLFMLMLVLRR
jgi:uncharacterized spore protein YtfJ